MILFICGIQKSNTNYTQNRPTDLENKPMVTKVGGGGRDTLGVWD